MRQRLWGLLILLLAGMMAAFRCLPGWAALWQGRIAVPLLGMLHRKSAALPFPLLEPLAAALLACCLSRRGRALALAMVLGMYGLLWYPAYFASPAREYPPPDAKRLEALCGELTDALNASPLDFNSPFDTAAEVAGLPWAGIKGVRYPEWMRALDISGLFSPWTGEALVDAGAPPERLPFTCVHELMHLRGVADEGEANIAAYEACVDRGGVFADSARLWALCYALSRLDEPARERVTRRASAELRRMLTLPEPRDASPILQWLGIGPQTRDYDGLVSWLLANSD